MTSTKPTACADYPAWTGPGQPIGIDRARKGGAWVATVHPDEYDDLWRYGDPADNIVLWHWVPGAKE